MAWTDKARKAALEARRTHARGKARTEAMRRQASATAKSERGVSGRFETKHSGRDIVSLGSFGQFAQFAKSRLTGMQRATELYNQLLSGRTSAHKEYPTYLGDLRSRAKSQPRAPTGRFVSRAVRNEHVSSLLGGKYVGDDRALMRKRISALSRLTQMATRDVATSHTKLGTVRVSTKQLADAIYRTDLRVLRRISR